MTRDFPPRTNGGVSTAVGQMVSALGEHVSCSVISFDGWRRGAPVRPIASSGEVFRVSGGAGLDEARQWGRQQQPEVVHVHDPLLFDFSSEVANGCPLVLSLHVLAHHQDQLRGVEKPTRSASAQARAIAAAAVILAPSESSAQIVCADFPDARSRVVCAPLATAGTPLPRTPSERATFLFCGRFSDMSGIDQIAPIAEASAGRFELVVAGGLPDNPKADGRWRERLGHPSVRLTGWLSSDALARERATATALIAPARFATFGLAVLEAMHAGLPVIAYSVGGIAELVEDGRTGALVEVGDTVGLVEAAVAIADDRDLARSMGEAGRARALGEYSWAKRIGPVLDAYRD